MWSRRAGWIVFGLSIAAVSPRALAKDFACPPGTRDSGERHGQIVRWCEIVRDGRLLYHGPVWRWHRNGQLASKEWFVYGDTEGESTAWYPNGKTSAAGVWKGGRKAGRWSYWNDDGSLRADVRYEEQLSAVTEYYPAGQTKVTGTFHHGGKYGLWVYLNEDKSERARCDFSTGLFALPEDDAKKRACQLIVDAFEPKAFGRPRQSGTVREGGNASVAVGPQNYDVITPKGWVADADAARSDDIPLVFYRQGAGWKQAGPRMYLRPMFKEGRTLRAVSEAERRTAADKVDRYRDTPLKVPGLEPHRPVIARTVTYRPVFATDSPFDVRGTNTVREAVVFVDVSPELVLLAVLVTSSAADLKRWMSDLSSLVTSIEARN